MPTCEPWALSETGNLMVTKKKYCCLLKKNYSIKNFKKKKKNFSVWITLNAAYHFKIIFTISDYMKNKIKNLSRIGPKITKQKPFYFLDPVFFVYSTVFTPRFDTSVAILYNIHCSAVLSWHCLAKISHL